MSDLYSLLMKKNPVGVEFHWDADGVYAASLLLKTEGLKIAQQEVDGEIREMLHSPEEFGGYSYDVALDLGAPLNKEYSGIVVDHHPNHSTDRKYSLFWGEVPTTLLVWENLKDHIPKEEWWRVVGGLVGDMAEDKVPAEIWDYFPELFDTNGTVRKWDGKISSFRIPNYLSLSSAVNSLCRLGQPLVALKTCLEWKSPMDAIKDPTVLNAKNTVYLENKFIFNHPMPEIAIKNKFAVITIQTSQPTYSMAGYVASSLANDPHYKFLTVIVVNRTSGEISIRGTLAKYIADKLSGIGYKAGGHSQAAGCRVEPQDVDKFIEDVRRLA